MYIQFCTYTQKWQGISGSSRASAQWVTAVVTTYYLHNISAINTYAPAHDAQQYLLPRTHIHIYTYTCIYIYVCVCTRARCTTTALISYLFKDAGGSRRATARRVTAVDITYYLHNITIVKIYAHAHDALPQLSPRSHIHIHIHTYIYIYVCICTRTRRTTGHCSRCYLLFTQYYYCEHICTRTRRTTTTFPSYSYTNTNIYIFMFVYAHAHDALQQHSPPTPPKEQAEVGGRLLGGSLQLFLHTISGSLQ